MKRWMINVFAVVASMVMLSSCSGVKYISVETREPAQVVLPSNVQRVAIVSNVVQQPNDVGHWMHSLGQSEKRVKASADSVAIYFTEAMSQFLNEEDYFLDVIYYGRQLRGDKDYFQEQILPTDEMNKIRQETGADAVISLDKLLIETRMKEHFRYQGYMYGELKGDIHSTLRVYMPSMEGKIPKVEYSDSLMWMGFDLPNESAYYAEEILPSREDAMKMLAVRAAEKMSNVFAPHWEAQDRWYYTSNKSAMKDAMTLAENMDWTGAISKWEAYYNSISNKREKARVASNIALAYEMMDDMNLAYEWAKTAKDLLVESTGEDSLDRRRAVLYLNEIERRRSNKNRIDLNDY
ncbi:MAG: DUF6340 family protein [Fermentimonas sp.]|jgi:hypothetical protein